jgi:tRNA(Arg) A34 adenosine deaminase TadA
MPSKKTKSRARRRANEAKAKEKKDGSEAVADVVVEEQGSLIAAQMQRLTIDDVSLESSATNNRNHSPWYVLGA